MSYKDVSGCFSHSSNYELYICKFAHNIIYMLYITLDYNLDVISNTVLANLNITQNLFHRVERLSITLMCRNMVTRDNSHHFNIL